MKPSLRMPITNQNQYAHDSFITTKKQLHNNENSII
jgi:hypothetical protein